MAGFRFSNPPSTSPKELLTQGDYTEVDLTAPPYSPQVRKRVAKQQRSIRRMKIVTGISMTLVLTIVVRQYERFHRTVEPHATTPSLATAARQQPPSLSHGELPRQADNSNRQSASPESLVTATTEEVISAIHEPALDADLSRNFNEARAGSQYQMGLRYVNGEGVTQNYQNAMKWFAEASRAGDGKAQWKLALGYLKGIGVPQDGHQAMVWLKRAANNGVPQAQRALSEMYLIGSETSRDYVRAYTWADIASGLEERDSDQVRLQTIRSRMTPIQIADAERRSSIWRDYASRGRQR
jgi:hypothetical protein